MIQQNNVDDIGTLETQCVGDKFEISVSNQLFNIKSQARTSNNGHQHHILAYYDVAGDVDRFEGHQHVEKSMQHNRFIVSMKKWSPALSNQHNDVTNIRLASETLRQKIGPTNRLT